MIFSLVTYNILFNKASAHLNKIFEGEKTDIVCLQEVKTQENNLKEFEGSTLRLADFTNSFIKFAKIFGVATLYNPQRLKFVDSQCIDLPQSFLEVFLVFIRGINRPRTVLKTEFIDKGTNKKLTVYNVHLTPFATNGTRIRQLEETLSNTTSKNDDAVIIAGDFNFPYGRKKLEKIFMKNGFQEATNKIFHTAHLFFYRRIFRKWSKLDYVFYKNMKHLGTKKIISEHSDHYPIISRFELK